MYWSLEVELSFYLWVAAARAAGRLRQLPAVLAGLMAAGGLWQAAGPVPLAYDHHQPFALRLAALVGLTRYVHYFAAGVALHLAWSGRRRAAAALAAAAAGYAAATEPARDLAVGVALAAAAGVAVWVRPGWLSNPVFLFLGTISYPLYLVHAWAGMAVIRQALAAGAGPYAAVLLATGLSVGVAAAVSYGVEWPAVRWGRRVWPPGRREWSPGGGGPPPAIGDATRDPGRRG